MKFQLECHPLMMGIPLQDLGQNKLLIFFANSSVVKSHKGVKGTHSFKLTTDCKEYFSLFCTLSNCTITLMVLMYIEEV